MTDMLIFGLGYDFIIHRHQTDNLRQVQQTNQQCRAITNHPPSSTQSVIRGRTTYFHIRRITRKLRLNSNFNIQKKTFPKERHSPLIHTPSTDSSRMRPINSVMPISRRILIPIPIPIPPRHKMSLHPPKPPTLPPPITILHRTPSPLIRNLVLAPTEIVSHRGIFPRPRDGRIVRV